MIDARNPARDLSAQVGEGSDCPSLDFHNAASDPSAILAKGQQPLRDDLTDQPRLVFIGRPFAVPFIFVPFHNGRDTRA